MQEPKKPRGIPLFRSEYDCAEWNGSARSYLICSTPRSGSTLLSELFRATGRMGVPAEYLTGRHIMPRMAQRLGAVRADGAVDISAYLAALRRWRTSPNGLFGMKVHFRDLQPLLHLPAIGAFVRRSRLIRIQRRDIVAQAISLEIAERTGRWNRSRDDVEEAVDLPYSRDRIARQIAALAVEERELTLLFEANGLAPYCIDYEDLLADCGAVAGAAARHAGLADPPAFSLAEAPIAQQRDTLGARWRKCHVEAYRLGHGDGVPAAAATIGA